MIPVWIVIAGGAVLAHLMTKESKDGSTVKNRPSNPVQKETQNEHEATADSGRDQFGDDLGVEQRGVHPQHRQVGLTSAVQNEAESEPKEEVCEASGEAEPQKSE